MIFVFFEIRQILRRVSGHEIHENFDYDLAVGV